MLLLFVMELLPASSQDRIYSKHPPKIIEAHVMEVDIGFIKYRKSDNPDGPVYKYPKKYVDSIVYANGSADHFSTGRQHRPISAEKLKRQKEYEKLGSNTFIASGGVFDLARPDLELNRPANMRNRPSAIFQLSYEHTLLNDRLGLDVAPFIGLNDGAYGFGFAMRFYPRNKGRVRVGMGPQYILSVKKAISRYLVTNPDNSASFGYVSTVYVRERARLSSLAFTGKITVNLNKVLCLAGNFGIGGVLGGEASNDHHPAYWEKNFFNVYYKGSLGIGFRF